MNWELLDFAAFFDDDVDGALGAGQRRKGEFNDRGSAIFSAESKAFVNW